MFDLDVTHAHSPQPTRLRFEGLDIRISELQHVADQPTLLARLSAVFARVRKPAQDRATVAARTDLRRAN
jgi:hypothetical protein